MSSEQTGQDQIRHSSPGRKLYREFARELCTAFEARAAGREMDDPLEARALVKDAWRENASDVHLDPQRDGYLVRMRIDGMLLDVVRVEQDASLRLVNQFKNLAEVGPESVHRAAEGRFSVAIEDGEDVFPIDLRFALIPCIDGEKMTLRLLVRRHVERQIDSLGLSDDDFDNIRGWLESLNGMFLAAGPTGSGKTTTLYALLHQLRMLERNIMTIEDPIEYDIEGINQVQVNPDQGLDFASGAKALLRLDPDFLLIGEVRDGESARSAINAAASGRIMLGTLHSHDAAGVVGVLRNYGLQDLEIAPNLAIVVAQRLVRTLCGECRELGPIAKADRKFLQEMGMKAPAKAGYPQGCEACNGVGYRGQTGIFEVWRLDEEDYRLILDHADDQTLRQSLKKRGHRSLQEEAVNKVAAGLISPVEVKALSGFGPFSGPPGKKPRR